MQIVYKKNIASSIWFACMILASFSIGYIIGALTLTLGWQLTDIYYYMVGSASDCMIESDISNESIMSILLDIKVCYNILKENDQVSYANLLYYISDIMHEYDKEIRIILAEWMESVYIDKVYPKETYSYNLIN